MPRALPVLFAVVAATVPASVHAETPADSGESGLMVWAQGYVSTRTTRADASLWTAGDVGLRLVVGKSAWTGEHSVLPGFADTMDGLEAGLGGGVFVRQETAHPASGEASGLAAGVSLVRVGRSPTGRPAVLYIEGGPRWSLDDSHSVMGAADGGVQRGLVTFGWQMSLVESLWFGPVGEVQFGADLPFEESVGLQVGHVF